jgi:hypothetical protein
VQRPKTAKAGGRLLLARNAIDAGGRRRMRDDVVEKSLDRAVFSLDVDLDAAVGHIPDGSGNVVALCDLEHRLAKEHALHQALENDQFMLHGQVASKNISPLGTQRALPATSWGSKRAIFAGYAVLRGRLLLSLSLL